MNMLLYTRRRRAANAIYFILLHRFTTVQTTRYSRQMSASAYKLSKIPERFQNPDVLWTSRKQAYTVSQQRLGLQLYF